MTIMTSSASDSDWVHEALYQIPTVAQPIPLVSPEISSQTRKPSERPLIQDENQNPDLRASMKSFRNLEAPLHKKLSELIEKGDYEAAYKETIDFNEIHGQDWSLGWLWISSTALLAGNYKESELLFGDHLRKHTGTNDTPYVGLSAALAMQGRILAGQAEFTGEALERIVSQSGTFLVEKRLRHPSTAKETAVAAIVAFGWASVYASSYMEWALRLDPKCELAAKRLFDDYRALGRTNDAVRIAGAMVHNLPAGTNREEFVKQLAMLKRIKN